MKRGLITGVMAALMLAVCGSALAQAQWRHAGGQGMRHFVVVAPAVSAEVETLKQAAREVCMSDQACVVMFWLEGATVPSRMPMTRAQQQAVVAQFFRNSATGSEVLLLKCKADEPTGHNCLR